MAKALWEIVWKFLIKLKIYLSYDPAILFLYTYHRETQAYTLTKIVSPNGNNSNVLQ